MTGYCSIDSTCSIVFIAGRRPTRLLLFPITGNRRHFTNILKRLTMSCRDQTCDLARQTQATHLRCCPRFRELSRPTFPRHLLHPSLLHRTPAHHHRQDLHTMATTRASSAASAYKINSGVDQSLQGYPRAGMRCEWCLKVILHDRSHHLRPSTPTLLFDLHQFL